MSTTSQQPVFLRTGNDVDDELAGLIEQVKEGRLDNLRHFVARTRAAGDWQDRLFVLERVVPHISIDLLNAACQAEQESPDLLVIRCAYYTELSKTMRGTGTSDKVGEARYRNAGACMQAAMNDMSRSTQLDPQDPTTYTLVLKPLIIFSQTELIQKSAGKALALAPHLAHVYIALTTAASERWGGSHRESVGIARDATSKAGPGSDVAGCLFHAHSLVRSHLVYFDKNLPAAKRYAYDPQVTEELNGALDAWLVPTYVASRSSMPFLRTASAWYKVVMDAERYKRVVAFTGESFDPMDFLSAEKDRQAAARGKGGFFNRLFGSGR